MPKSTPVTPTHAPRRLAILPPTPPSTPRVRESSVVLSREVIRVKSELSTPPPRQVKREPSEAVSPSTSTRRGMMGPPPTPNSARQRAPSTSPRRSNSIIPYPIGLRRPLSESTPGPDPYRSRSYSRARSEVSLASAAESFFDVPQRHSRRNNLPRPSRGADGFGDAASPAHKVPPARVSLPTGLDRALKRAKETLGSLKVKEREPSTEEEVFTIESKERLLIEVLFEVDHIGGQAFQAILVRSDIIIRPAELSLLLNYLRLKVPAAVHATLCDYSVLPFGASKSSKDRAVRSASWWEAVRGGIKDEARSLKACMTKKNVEGVLRALYLFWAGDNGNAMYNDLKDRFDNLSYDEYLDAVGAVKDVCSEVMSEAWA